MKKFLIFLILCPVCGILFSQNPQGFNYQAIARDGSGNPITGKTLGVRLTIQSDSTGGKIFWQELHSSVTTNNFGLLTLVLGKGTKTGGEASTFDAIDWSITPKFINTEIDYGGWVWMGSSRIWSVPYSNLSEATRGIAAGSKLAIVGTDDASEEALFEVKRKDGQTVFAVYNDAVNVYVPDQAKGAKGGFAVGGFGQIKGFSQHYFTVTPDSIRFYIDTTSLKGAKGGFAVGGFGQTKGSEKKYLSLSGTSSVDTITNASQIMWYPRKEAFLAGRVDILHADSVGRNSFSMGYKNQAKGDYSHAMGYKAVARGNYSTAIGREAVSGLNSFALGNFSTALGNDSYAVGSGSHASGPTSFALGVGSESNGLASLSIGYQSVASAPYAVAIGYFAKALANTAHSFGLKAEALAEGSIALGMYSQAQANFSTSLGYYSIANKEFSTAIGYHAFASGFDSYAIGSYTEANGEKSFAIGSFGLNEDGSPNPARKTWTPGYYSLAFGMGAQATNIGAMSLGINTTASGGQSVAIGFGTTASNQFATAMGFKASANGMKSIAIGAHYHVTFDKLVWEWDEINGKWIISNVPTEVNKPTSADGDFSVAIGNGNYSKDGGLTLGTNNNAMAFGSVSLGHSNEAVAEFSFAAGFGNHAEGLKSFAIGENLNVKSANSFVIGAYNKIEGVSNEWIPSDPLFVIGNGNPVERSNAFTVLKDGNIVLSPGIKVGAAGLQLVYDPADGLMKKVTSSARYKSEIAPVGDISWLYDLKPMRFVYKNDMSHSTQYGLLAEDMESVNKALVVYQEGEPEGINYNSLLAPIIKAIQDQKKLIDDLDSRNSDLLKENEELKERLEIIENAVFSKK